MKLTVEKALEIVKEKDQRRFHHIYGTYKKAKELAQKYNIDTYKAMIAAILHDIAKNEETETTQKIIIEHFNSELLYYETICHGYVGSYLIQKDYGILDEEIIEAVKYHVTGHPDMGNIGKIVYIADYIEKGRKQPGVDFCRYASMISLDVGVLTVSESTYNYLKQVKPHHIHPLTKHTYEKFLEKVGVHVYDAIKNDYKNM